MSRGKRKRNPQREESGSAETPTKSPASTPRSTQVLILLIFGLGFAALLVGLLVFKGDDAPPERSGSDVPPGFIATVHSPNGNVVDVSEAEFEHAMGIESDRRLRKVPQQGDKRVEDLQATVLGNLLERIWTREEAQALGVSVGREEVASELAEIKAEDYPTEAAYQRYLKESRQTPQDVEREIENQFLAIKVRERAGGPVSPGEEEEFAIAEFQAELEEKWVPRTQCAPKFLDLVGSGGLLGAGYVIEGHCAGASKGHAALEETQEQIREIKAKERQEKGDGGR